MAIQCFFRGTVRSYRRGGYDRLCLAVAATLSRAARTSESDSMRADCAAGLLGVWERPVVPEPGSALDGSIVDSPVLPETKTGTGVIPIADVWQPKSAHE